MHLVLANNLVFFSNIWMPKVVFIAALFLTQTKYIAMDGQVCFSRWWISAHQSNPVHMWLLIGILFPAVCYTCSVGTTLRISDPRQIILPGAVIITRPTTPPSHSTFHSSTSYMHGWKSANPASYLCSSMGCNDSVSLVKYSNGCPQVLNSYCSELFKE